jgi:hypothetical protein
VIVARFVFPRKISRPAFREFCNTITQSTDIVRAVRLVRFVPEGTSTVRWAARDRPKAVSHSGKKAFRQTSTWMEILERTQSDCPAFSRLA